MGEYAVIGLGRFGRSLVAELQSLGNEILGIDMDRQIVQDMSSVITHSVQADATSEATLRELGVANLDAAIVAMGKPESSILITLVLKKLGVRYVIAKAATELHGEILNLVGADRVVFPEKETALRLAHGIGVPEVVDYLSITKEMGISKLSVPRHLVNLSYSEARLEQRFHVRLIAIIRRNNVLFGASVGEQFQQEDVLLISGRDTDLRALTRSEGD